MKNPISQYPKPRESPSPNQHARLANRYIASSHSWGLRLGASFALGVWCLGLWLNTNVQAQSYSIDWSAVDGGGGTSTGRVYSVSGTIGQPDAGEPITDGSFSLTGGFWALCALQTPGAPPLSIARTATNTVVVWWSLPDTGWKLQAATSLVAPGSIWMEIPPPYTTNTTSLYRVEPMPLGNKFYRLHKP
jgi:hypothetical protein